MFTEILARPASRRILGSSLLDLLTGPHGVDRYTELLDPTLVSGEARARVVAVRRTTPRSVTLTLAPNEAFTAANAFRAGQHVNVTVEIDGRRHSRCYSPANAQGAELLELTVGQHEGGLVSNFLYQRAQVGMVVGVDGVAGDFVLPPTPARRILFVAGGSGITPVLSMLRTLVAQGHTGELAVIHYARSQAEACYRAELAALPGVRVLHGYTRSLDGADLSGHFDSGHVEAALPNPDAVYVCGPNALAEAVRTHCGQVSGRVSSESFTPPEFVRPTEVSGGRVSFTDSDVDVTDDGRSLLEQAEAAGLNPQSGCRMGICHTCTRRKACGTVMNLTTGAVSTDGDEDIQICVSVPVGDVQIAL